MFTKDKIAMMVAELLGTFLLTLAFVSVLTSNIGIGYFVSLGAGLTLGLLVLLLGGISGAVLNPAVTIGLWSVRKLQTYQAIIYLALQLLGGLLAYVLFNYISGNHLSDRTIAKYDNHILVAEVVGTAVLAMGYAAAAYQNLLSGVKGFVIGGAFAVGIIIAAAQVSAGYLNPAVALGAHALDMGNWGSLGNFVLGPVLGAVIGFNLYNLLFAAGEPVVASARAASRAAALDTVTPARPARAARVKTTTRTKVATAKTKKPVARKR